MQQWEYKIEWLGLSMHYSEVEFDSLGKSGWELVQVCNDDGVWYAVFKRPKA